MYGSGVGTGMAAEAAIPAVQRILQDRLPAVTGCYVAAVGTTAAPQAVPSRTGTSTTPASGTAATAATASASSALRGNPFWLLW